MSKRARLLFILAAILFTIYYFYSPQSLPLPKPDPLPPPPLAPVAERVVVPNIKMNARPFGDPRELGFKPAANGDERKKWVPAPVEDVVRPPKAQARPRPDDKLKKPLAAMPKPIPAAPAKPRPAVAAAKKLKPKPKPKEVEDEISFVDDGEEEDEDDSQATAEKAVEDEETEAADDEDEEEDEDLMEEGDLDAAQSDGRRRKGSVNKLNKPLAAGAGKTRGKRPKQAGKKDPKWGGGWSERFKQKPGAGDAAGPGAPNMFLDSNGLPLKGPAPPKQPEPIVEGILAHPLVARLAAYDFSRSAPTSKTDKNTFKAPSQAPISDTKPHNLTLCALIPSETRFLPEWLLYHRSLGIERFALYDTAVTGAVGGEERDAVADLLEKEGKGEHALGPKANEIKDQLLGFRVNSASGLDDKGKVWPERIAGLERWMEQGVVEYHWMSFRDVSSARNFHSTMLDHCRGTYARSSAWLLSLDVDEFLVMSNPLYGATSPSTSPSVSEAGELSWQYPLHELLEKETLKEAACIPVPQFRYRNVGIRTLGAGEHVLKMQTKRDVLVNKENLPEKTLIHTAFSSDFVSFDGPHSCKVDPDAEVPEGLTTEIRNSQGALLQTQGGYKSMRLPTEPLSIAHFLQRDLTDCNQKIADLDDPNSLHAKGRGAVLCEEHYLPSPEELASTAFISDESNRFLARLPADGTVVEDLRVRESWPAKAAHAVLEAWEGQSPPSLREIELARNRVFMLSF